MQHKYWQQTMLEAAEKELAQRILVEAAQ